MSASVARLCECQPGPFNPRQRYDAEPGGQAPLKSVSNMRLHLNSRLGESAV